MPKKTIKQLRLLHIIAILSINLHINAQSTPILSLIKSDSIQIHSIRTQLPIPPNEVIYLRIAGEISEDSLIALLQQMNQLKYLDIPYGNAWDLERIFNHLPAPQSLTHLYIENLDTLSPAINQLTALEWLGINNAALTSIPKELSALKKLRVLNLGYIYKHFCNGNRLKAIPLAIFELSELEELYLNDNQLSTIPKQICSLQKLKILSAKGNAIQQIPNCLIQSKVKVILD